MFGYAKSIKYTREGLGRVTSGCCGRVDLGDRQRQGCNDGHETCRLAYVVIVATKLAMETATRVQSQLPINRKHFGPNVCCSTAFRHHTISGILHTPCSTPCRPTPCTCVLAARRRASVQCVFDTLDDSGHIRLAQTAAVQPPMPRSASSTFRS